MIIGVPKESKTEEYRVGLTPSGASELERHGHRVLVETGAGEGSGFSDEAYTNAGAQIVSVEDAWVRADLVVKVKEPVPAEYSCLRKGGAIFTYLHLAPNPDLTRVLLEKRIAGLAYETLEVDGMLPLLRPMSEIAGRMAPLVASYHLQKAEGGTGVLPPGATGVPAARALILGAGVAGSNAARVAHGIGLDTTVMNISAGALRRLDEQFSGAIRTRYLSRPALLEEIEGSDIVIGAVLVPGGRTPVLITRAMLGSMKPGAVVVDISVDQGGCVETTRPTTHADPVYDVDGVLHYAVANMPGAYPNTATLALTNETLPYILRIAEEGIEAAVERDEKLRSALNTLHGRIVHPRLAVDVGAPAGESQSRS